MRTVKREPIANSSHGRANATVDRGGADHRFVEVKREKVRRNNRNEGAGAEPTQPSQQDDSSRRVLRSKYLAVKNLISESRDDLLRANLEKFNSIITEVESLHELVQKPREQVADAEALLDITNTFVSFVKSHSGDGVTPSDFITSLLKDFGQHRIASNSADNDQVSVLWRDLGLAVSPIFKKCYGCCTMLGPMNTQVKERKAAVHRKRTRPNESARPEELDDAGAEDKTDTDKNMAMMFEILRRNRSVRLENLILNRKSFAQTVENLFALSFLAKDGRAEITVDDKGTHIVSPKNAPAANAVMSREVSYGHFVFRFDFRDWKLMLDAVPSGEELMPNRDPCVNSSAYQADPVSSNSKPALPKTPIRKLTRNHGLVIQEETVVEDSPEIDDEASMRDAAIRKCKRKLH